MYVDRYTEIVHRETEAPKSQYLLPGILDNSQLLIVYGL